MEGTQRNGPHSESAPSRGDQRPKESPKTPATQPKQKDRAQLESELFVVDLLRRQSLSKPANLILEPKGIDSRRPDIPTWVFGSKDLVDSVKDHADIQRFDVYELVRSDTGFWRDIAHAGSLPFRFFAGDFLERLTDVEIQTPPELPNHVLAKFSFGDSNQNGLFHVHHAQSDDLSGIDPSYIVDLSAAMDEDAIDTLDVIVEGNKLALKHRMKATGNTRKHSQRKSDVGVQLRLSCDTTALQAIGSSDMTWHKIGSRYPAGLSIRLADGMWPELHPLLARSHWQGSVARSDRWVTVGCSTAQEVDALLHHLREWRESGRISHDIRFRRWEIEATTLSSPTGVLSYVGNGVLRASSLSATARNIPGCLKEADIQRFLRARQITPDFSIYSERGQLCLEVRGDVQWMQGRTEYIKWGGSILKLSFDKPVSATPALDAFAPGKAAPNAHTSAMPFAPSSEVGISDPAEPMSSGAKRGRSRSSKGSSSSTFVAGNVVKAPLLKPPPDNAQPGIPLVQGSEPTTAIRLLTRDVLPGDRECWSGIRLTDEVRIDAIKVIPKPVSRETSRGHIDYLQLRDSLAKEANVYQGQESKHIPLPPVDDPNRTEVVTKAYEEAAHWTSTIKQWESKRCVVHIVDPAPSSQANPKTQDLSSDSAKGHTGKRPKAYPPSSGQEHQDFSDTTSFSTQKSDVLLQNADKNETPPNAGFDDSKAYNLFLAVQATPQEVLAAQIVGGKEGDKDARERLNPRPISAPSQATPHSSPLGISAAQAATAS